MMKFDLAVASVMCVSPSMAQQDCYKNPVINVSAPDPTVLRADDGTFYLYTTEDIRNVPIFHSSDLVNWSMKGTAFSDSSRPQWLPEGGIWAPDINKVGDRYLLYYAKSVWGGEWDAGIGVAVADRPEGPFEDMGNMFVSRDIGTQNSIDPFYIEDGGRKYLFWGSFSGIFGIELAEDGLSVKSGETPRQIAGTFMEAAYIKRHGGYYYLFGSAGTCCDGENSTYRVTVGRSENLFGPYVDRKGKKLLDNHYELVLYRNENVIGPGHNSELITDDDGQDWMLYHGFDAGCPEKGRLVWLDKVDWVDGWPYVSGCTPSRISAMPRFRDGYTVTLSGLKAADFEADIVGKRTHLYRLANKNGMELCLTNFGARIVSVTVPDKDGKMTDVVLGYDNIAQYADYADFGSDFGASIGRYANRINQGKLVVDGRVIQLPQNNYGHCLHGGFSGWQYQVFDGQQLNDSTVQMTLFSPDNDNGFPGNVRATVTYTLTSQNGIDIRYEATTDRKTVVNMTNHSYFNLDGTPSLAVDDHILYINADSYTPSDETYMTTGEIVDVKGTPMDFRKPTALGKNINNMDFDMIGNAGGFDHNWCLNTYRNGTGDIREVAASLYSKKTGILMEVFTDEPGIQIYTGNFLDGGISCKHGYRYPQHAAVCLETQHYPDSPNKPDWPSTWLSPGEAYKSHTIYRFSVRNSSQGKKIR